MNFFSGSNNLGSAGVATSNGPLGFTTTATLNATQLANGQYTITASYGGDTNYVASTSGPTAITIQPDFSIQASSDALLIQNPGSSGSMTVLMTDLDGFTGTVTFSCLGLPAEAKCSFNPATLSASGSTNLTITTTRKTGMLKRGGVGAEWNLALAMSAMAVGGVFMFGVPRSHRRRRKLLFTIALAALCVSCGGGGGVATEDAGGTAAARTARRGGPGRRTGGQPLHRAPLLGDADLAADAVRPRDLALGADGAPAPGAQGPALPVAVPVADGGVDLEVGALGGHDPGFCPARAIRATRRGGRVTSRPFRARP